ncbi:MAG: NAD(P)-dependent alcohol dehydrogenase [Actinomycetota bacterium]|jgi:L-iditol 2-dehydrogenase|nr:NAD(P)-dependent alcohol dehydrogenase [Actinomycetota bacterium]
MKALYLMQKQVLQERDLPIPEPTDCEVQIKVKSVGVCGSDIHYYEHGRIGDMIVREPLILGHEVSGEITRIGSHVKDLEIGELVVIEPFVVCGKCEACRTGRYNLCPDHKFYATPPFDGALREYVTFDSSFVHKVPEGINAELATLVEPMAVGIYSSRCVGTGLGDKVIIYGAGVVGLCCLICAYSAGAKEVTMVDVRDDRLKIAEKLGATRIINPAHDDPSQYLNYYDIAYECSGAEPALIDASNRVKVGGRISAIGFHTKTTQEAPITQMVIKTQQLVATFRYANSFPAALDIILKNRDKVTKFITHRFKFEDSEKAFIAARDDKSAIKVMINM